MTDDTVVTAPPKKTVRPIGSEYMILSEQEPGRWELAARNATGRDAEHAIRRYAEANGNEPGTFVAVPAKSWKPLTVRAETVTTLKLEEVK